MNKTVRINKRISISLDSGDIYIMNTKATGNDWKNTNIFTFDKTEINLSNYTSKSILHPKIQELKPKIPNPQSKIQAP